MELVLYYTFLNTFIYSSLFCFFVDVFFPGCRVNDVTRDVVLWDYYNMVPLVAGNIVIAYPYFYASEKYLTYYEPSNNYGFVLNFLLWAIVTDILFYSIHRAFHTKYLYHYHSIHHTYRYTYGMGAIYAHPLEFVLSNLFPISAPMILFGMDYEMCNTIVMFATFFTVVISHGCFRLPVLSTSHLYHHLKYKYNFGFLKTDEIMGTNYIEN